MTPALLAQYSAPLGKPTVAAVDAMLDAVEFLAVDKDQMTAWLDSPDGDISGGVNLFRWYVEHFKVGDHYASLSF